MGSHKKIHDEISVDYVILYVNNMDFTMYYRN